MKYFLGGYFMSDYKELYLPSHHRAKRNGMVDEHIVLAEKLIGRDLKDGEVVHHKDSNKENNSLQNLMIFCSNKAHITFHRGGLPIPLDDGTYDCKPTTQSYCKQCGVQLKTRGASICQLCLHIKQRVCQHPSREQLQKDIDELKTNVAIAKKYNVSDKTIAKWRQKII